jgi:hypothetical protein
MTSRYRPALALTAFWLLAGCAGGTGRTQARTQGAGPVAAPAAAGTAEARTGIAACDDYLASYRACHRAAGIFPPDQLDGHYRSMRDSLLDAARDPRSRPLLGQRCRLLARQLGEALHGASCAAP